ncbi:polygalacturonase-like [Cylas formicarius]|uniref:polygalacturonase-like n=1 Tax=Cylas formicarius TaxID=197179 RepID=UPI00295896F9|nr:polygalacturonase-like [Cylas formicarius]
MSPFIVILTISVTNALLAENSCTVTLYDQVANALSTCTTLSIGSITVPAGQTQCWGGGCPNTGGGQGDNGRVKPKFVKTETTGNSVLKRIKVLNCPHQCVSIDGADTVKNQDDCVAVNQDSNIHLTGLTCSSTSPLSILQSQTLFSKFILEITRFIINVQEDYARGGSTGIHKNNIPMTGLDISEITATIWSKISYGGTVKANGCKNYTPAGLNCK